MFLPPQVAEKGCQHEIATVRLTIAAKAGECWTPRKAIVNHPGMDLRRITDRYFVAPQLEPQDMQAVADAGFSTVICNRPDPEVPVSKQADAMQRAAEAAGLAFHRLPLTHQTFTPENVQRQRSIAEAADGPVVAYCASGTRSTIVWALGQAGTLSVDEIVTAARDGGYDLSAIRPAIESAASGHS